MRERRECFLCGDVGTVAKRQDDHTGKWFCASKKPGDKKTCLAIARETMQRKK